MSWFRLAAPSEDPFWDGRSQAISAENIRLGFEAT
jgi:hypothetical protein